MNRGFTNPEIHEVKTISAYTVDLEGGAFVGIQFAQIRSDADQPFIGLPAIEIFGDADMAAKFARLATAINEIFGEPREVPIYDRPPTIASEGPFLGSNAFDGSHD